MAMFRQRAYGTLIVFGLLGSGVVWATPDTTMSVAPSCTAGTTITCADETNRNSTISTAYNTHSHTDITQTGRPLNIGAASGRTSIDDTGITFEGATNNAFETTVGVVDPTADRLFSFDNDDLEGGEFLIGQSGRIIGFRTIAGDATVTHQGVLTIANSAISTSKIANNSVDGTKIAMGSDAQGDVLYYNGTDYARLGVGSSGAFLQTKGAGANPQWATAGGEWIYVETLSPSAVTNISTSTLPTTSDLFKLVFDLSTAGGSTVGLLLQFNADAGANYSDNGAAVGATSIAVTTTGTGNHFHGGEIVLKRNGGSNFAGVTSQGFTINSTGVGNTFSKGGVWNGAGAVTTAQLSLAGGDTFTGKVFVYRFSQQ